MKKIIISLALLCTSCVAFAAIEKDTTSIDLSQIEQVIAEQTQNKMGIEYFKYYAVFQGELVNTNKSVYDRVMLCKKYGVKAHFLAIRNKSTMKVIRIILN